MGTTLYLYLKNPDNLDEFKPKKALFLTEIGRMKKGVFFVILLLISKALFAQNEIGPEGHKLLWVILFLVLFISAFFLLYRRNGKSKTNSRWPLFAGKDVRIELGKDSLYYPDRLTLKVKNTGNSDIDLDQPLLVFDNFWLKRKFRLKGFANRNFYPLYLEKGKTHTLEIDLNRFYQHDKRLRKFPKTKVIVNNVKGRRLGSRSIYLRKTLLKF